MERPSKLHDSKYIRDERPDILTPEAIPSETLEFNAIRLLEVGHRSQSVEIIVETADCWSGGSAARGSAKAALRLV